VGVIRLGVLATTWGRVTLAALEEGRETAGACSGLGGVVALRGHISTAAIPCAHPSVGMSNSGGSGFGVPLSTVEILVVVVVHGTCMLLLLLQMWLIMLEVVVVVVGIATTAGTRTPLGRDLRDDGRLGEGPRPTARWWCFCSSCGGVVVGGSSGLFGFSSEGLGGVAVLLFNF
jgi:hypothetical protein